MNLNPLKESNIATKHIMGNNDSDAYRKVLEYLQGGTNGNQSTRSYVNSFESNPLVYTVVNKIATSTAAIKRISVDRNGEEIKGSEILNLLENPNQNQGGQEFNEKIYVQLETSGNAFILFIEGIGDGAEIEVLESAEMTLKIDSLGGLTNYQYKDSTGTLIPYTLDEVLHIKKSTSSKSGLEWKYWGVSPLSALWTVVDSSNDLFTARASTWKNRGIIGFLTNRGENLMLPKERNILQDMMDKITGGASKANKIAVSTANTDFVQVGMSPSDLKLLEGNIDNLRTISAGYGISSVLCNDVSGSTFNNVESAKVEAYTDVYIPLANKVDAKLSKWLSIKLKVQETLKLDLTSIEALKSSTNEVANRLNLLPPAVASRFIEAITGDEARGILGLENIEGGNGLLGKSTEPKTDGQNEN